MPRTAPAPNIPAIPGMNPGLFVMAGGGSGGGAGGGSGSGSGGGQGANGQTGGDGATGGGNGAASCGTGSNGGCAQCSSLIGAGHPADVVTGRVFTEPQIDLELPGAMLLLQARQYNSAAADLDFGLGFGWGFSLGWRILVKRREAEVWTSECRKVVLPVPEPSTPSYSAAGWELSRHGETLVLDVGADTRRGFEPAPADSRFYLLRYLEDLAGNRIELSYEPDRIRLVDSVGRSLSLRLDRARRVTSIILEPGPGWHAQELVRYLYDAAGNLARVTRLGGASWRYEYDVDHLLTQEVHPSGLAFHFVYDAARRCIETWGAYPDDDPALDPEVTSVLADGKTPANGIHHVKLDHAEDGYVEVQNSYRLDRFFGNAHGLVDKAAIGGAVSSWTYDEAGNPTSYTDAAGNTTEYTYDDRSRLLSEIDPLGRAVELQRDDAGRVVAHVDAAGHAWTVERDPRGQLLATTTPNGHTYRVVRDDRGLVREEHLPTGAVIAYEYDDYANLVSITLPEGGKWRYEYDALGRKVSSTDPLGRTAKVWRDEAGRVTASRDSAGGVTHQQWDAEGRLVSLTDPDGGTYRFGWGGLHRLTSLTYPNGDTFRQLFDREGNLVTVAAPNGLRYRRSYDAMERPVAEETPDGRTTRFKYDGMGRLTEVENGADETTRYDYNAASEVIGAEYADGTQESFEYDPRGILVAVEGPDYRIDATYDPDRSLEVETQTVFGKPVTIEYERDALGQCARYTTSLGHTVGFDRTARGRLAAIVLGDSLRVEIDRDPHDLVRALRVSAGLAIEQTYDDLDRRTDVRVVGPGSSTPTARLSAAFSGAGNLLNRSTTVGSAKREETFGYDGKGRLTSWLSDKTQRFFAYDVIDNVTEGTPGAAPRDYSARGRLRSLGSTTFTWDRAGRLSERQHSEAATVEHCAFEWDGRGCLKKVTTGDGRTNTLVHDAQGRRLYKAVTRTLDGSLLSETRFVWDYNRLVHEIHTEPGGKPQIRTFLCEGEPAPMPRLIQTGDEWRWLVTHENGLPALLVSLTGRVEERLEFDVWGLPQSDAAADIPFRFSGQYADPELDLFENHFRYYDPAQGRYTSPDAMGILGGFNPYSYCLNPVGWTDPLGEMLMRLTTTAPGVDVNDPAPMPYSYRGAQPNYQPAPNEWRNYPRASMGTAGDCEQRIMGHLDPTGQGNPALAGQQVNMHCLGEPGTNMGPLPPCSSCRPRLRAFAQRNQCTVNYTMEGGGGVQFRPDGTMRRLP